MKSVIARSKSSRHVQRAKRTTGSVLAAIDLFKVAPQPRYSPEFFVSKRSRGATACVVIATLVYLVITVQRFVNVAPVIKITPTTASGTVFDAPELAVTVQYGEGYSQYVDDDDLLSVRALQGTTFDGNARREYANLDAQVCTITWAQSRPFPAWCPAAATPAKLQGQLAAPKFQFLQVDLMSSNVTKLLELGSGGPRIFAYLRTKFDSGEEHVVTLFWYPLETMQVRSEIIMQATDVIKTPNYISSFLTTSSTVLGYLREKVYTQQEQAVVGSRQVFFTLWVRLASVALEEEWRSPTIFDAISSVGALFTTVVGVLGLYFSRHNLNKFFRLNPDWDDLDISQGPRGVGNARQSTVNPLVTKEQELAQVGALRV